ncbi:MAG: DNA-formamidopyrimidine glycosylase family protein [Actinomycetes bacterium]
MPEGDTVWRTASRLHAVFAGRTLTRSDLRWPTLATADLTGSTTLEVVARGKHLLHRLDTGLTLHSHLRMEGSWRVQATTEPPVRLTAPKIRAVLATADWTAVGWSLGMLDLLPTTDERTLVGHLGPDVLGPDWDADRAVANLAAASAPIGAALLDQRNLAGLGTLWASEALFLACLDPWTPASALPAERLEALVRRAQRLVEANRHHAVQSSTGERGPGRTTYVHGRHHRPCRRCGVPIDVKPIGEAPRDRVMFFCPRCQSGPADARVQA